MVILLFPFPGLLKNKMKRQRRAQNLKKKNFNYTDLFPELKGEVRPRCTAVAQCMLSMTCREEYKRAGTFCHTDLLQLLAFEGDEDGLLRRYLSQKYLQRGSARLLHRIKHAVLAGEQVKLMEWLNHSLHSIGHQVCTWCELLAAFPGNVQLMITVLGTVELYWLCPMRQRYYKSGGATRFAEKTIELWHRFHVELWYDVPKKMLLSPLLLELYKERIADFIE
jgi:hypothetical protein